MKKKISIVTLLTILLVFVAGCSGGAKKEYIKYNEEMARKKEAAYDISFSIKDLELADEGASESKEENVVSSMMVSTLKDFEGKGTIQYEKKKKQMNLKADMSLNTLGMSLPVNIVGTLGDKNKMYMDTAMLVEAYGLIGMFTGEAVDMEANADLSELEGKYIEMDIEDSKEMKEAIKDINIDDSEQLTLDMDLSNDLFTKKEDKISLTVDKESMKKIIEKEKSKENKEFLKQLKDFKSYTIKDTINTKTNARTLTMSMEPKKEAQEEFGLKKLTLVIKIKEKKVKDGIKLPDKKDIIDEEFFSEDSFGSESDDLSVDELLKSDEEEKELEKKKKSAKPDTSKFKPIEGEDQATYKNDGESMEANVPDYSHYTKEDAIKVLGEPKETITDPEKIASILESTEIDKINKEIEAGKITEEQGKAFYISANDVQMATVFGANVEMLIYDDKPNVMILDNEVSYVTPMTDFVEFANAGK